MKKLSIQKLSLLGLVLMGASAVTAAVLPSNKKDSSKQAAQGSITFNATQNLAGSCTQTDEINDGVCNNTSTAGGASTTSGLAFESNTNTSGND
jgi:hypothetical protein